MAKWKVSYEEIKLQAENLVEKVKELIHDIQRVIFGSGDSRSGKK